MRKSFEAKQLTLLMEICQGNTVQLETKYFVSAFLMKKKKKKDLFVL